ncbi:hypothetical protein [Actinoalloteichus spitiensis]|uniref:hypothetical protein n=1 Tax=Actinoalloteichus spitiensis TaxID=252394 RepID=UPI00036FDC08|nr:hypothetical protein [Actinoalloteichus spitiensis]
MDDEPALARLRELDERVVAVSWRHLTSVGAGSLAAGVVGTLLGAVVGLVAVFSARGAGMATLGLVVVGWGALLALVWWTTLRPLTDRWGPVGAEYRRAVADRNAAEVALAAWSGRPVRGSASHDWARIDAVHARMDAWYARSTSLEQRHRASKPDSVLIGLVLVALVFVLVLVSLPPRGALGLLVAGPPLLVGWGLVMSVALRRLSEDAFVRSARIRGWRRELDHLARRLRTGAGVPAWRFPRFRVQRLWFFLKVGPSPAVVLRSLPAEANPLRRWFWRWLGRSALVPVGVVALLVVLGMFANR